MTQGPLDDRKAKSRAWFESLRDDICASFEALEMALPAEAPARFRMLSAKLRKKPAPKFARRRPLQKLSSRKARPKASFCKMAMKSMPTLSHRAWILDSRSSS